MARGRERDVRGVESELLDDAEAQHAGRLHRLVARPREDRRLDVADREQDVAGRRERDERAVVAALHETRADDLGDDGQRRYPARPETPRSSEHIATNASTTSGSNCVPPQRSISSTEWSNDRARRYGRSDVIASNVSHTEKMRADSGMR